MPISQILSLDLNFITGVFFKIHISLRYLTQSLGEYYLIKFKGREKGKKSRIFGGAMVQWEQIN